MDEQPVGYGSPANPGTPGGNDILSQPPLHNESTPAAPNAPNTEGKP